MGGTLHFEGGQIGAIFATMGISSLIMPGIVGIIADKWVNAERLLGICHLLGAGFLIYASTLTDYHQMYWAMLLNLLVYMPTLSLTNTVSYNALEQYKCDIVKDFPPIRVFDRLQKFQCTIVCSSDCGSDFRALFFFFASLSSC